jgi:hypothetical protein
MTRLTKTTSRMYLAVCLTAGMATTAAAQAGPGQVAEGTQEAQTTLKIGSRVGMIDSGYQEIGRRDPFAPLVRPPSASTPAVTAARRAAGLAGQAVADVELKGVIASGDTRMALLRGPDGKTYLARVQDRLHDAVIRRIEADAIVLLIAASPEEPAREVRKVIRPVAGGGQP